jgi:hypothetical protein
MLRAFCGGEVRRPLPKPLSGTHQPYRKNKMNTTPSGAASLLALPPLNHVSSPNFSGG